MKTPHPTDPVCTRRRALGPIAAALAAPWLAMPARAQSVNLDVPYVPTPQPVVDRMLEIARVERSDMVYDLGCGDGRIVVTAARRYGCRGVGIDIDPQRIAEARANAREAGVTRLVDFRVADLFQSDFSQATVVTLYLLPEINLRLRPQLWRQLRVGTRIVSHDFTMGNDWPPERTERVEHKTLYSWTITQALKDSVR